MPESPVRELRQMIISQLASPLLKERGQGEKEI
jgi:hypothetical protein